MNKYAKSLLNNVNYPIDLKKFSIDNLVQLSEEVRELVLHSISKTGGHLGASLGVVELTVVLHYTFNAPIDKIVWDVGHQSYPHKILTGRKDMMETIRKKDGLSGFCKRSESEYDVFGAGHSSTSISAALGIATGQKLSANNNDNVIAVIGDGAMSAGMAFEGLNNVGFIPNRLIIILNDNDMSISQPTGALKNYFSDLISSQPYLNVRQKTKNVLKNFPIIKSQVKKVEQIAKSIVNDSTIFDNLGLDYIGPIDGHNIESMVNVFSRIKKQEDRSPIVIHVHTKKGYGYEPAENSNDKYHGVSQFNVATGKQKTTSTIVSYSKIFAETLSYQAEKDKKIVAITAAMPDGTGLNHFKKLFPKRCFDVGIAEQHAVTFAAGLTLEKYKPFVCIYATFLQRAYDQIVHDVAIQNLPVRFAIDRAGLVGADGATHAGSFDIAFLSNLPNFVVMAASDAKELVRMVITASEYNHGPIAFRYPKANVEFEYKSIIEENLNSIEIGKGELLKKGKEIAILSLGARLHSVQEAVNDFEEKYNDRSVTIVNARFAKPLDIKLIKEIATEHRYLIIIEEGVVGGFSSHVLDYLNKENLLTDKLIVKTMYLPDRFQEQDSVEGMYKEAKLDKDSILSVLESFVS